MNAIQNHIDYLFQDLPQTDEIKQIKIELYLNTMDRYQELLSLGKAESEALGTIIIEIGDRDELLEDLGYHLDKDRKDYSLNRLEEARFFIASNSRESNKIGMGILIILIGAGLIPTAETFNMVEIGVILFLLLVAMAVGMFIHSGLKLETINRNFEQDDYAFYLKKEDYETVEHHFTDFLEKERYRIPLGVILCILAVIPILFFEFLNSELGIERYGVLLLTTAVGIGVFQFVKYGMIYSAYKRVLALDEYSVEERQFQQKVEPISSLYWLVITVIYLAWSFLTMGWHISWIIWPIAGVVWALIAMVLKMMNDRGNQGKGYK